MSGNSSKQDKDDGILGDGLAEMARKKLRSRQQQLDDILGESTGVPEPKAEPKKDTTKKTKRERLDSDFL